MDDHASEKILEESEKIAPSFAFGKRQRNHTIDLIKAVSIVMVILLHSLTAKFLPDDALGRFVADVIRFAVPALLFSSGYLFKKKELDDWQLIRRLLLRIGPPYIIISLIILFLNLPGNTLKSYPPTLNNILFNLCFGNTLGIYYFVFVISYLYAASLLLRRLSEKTILWLWVISICLLILFHKDMSLFVPSSQNWFFMMVFRHPVYHFPPYLTGWLFSINAQRIHGFLQRRWKMIIVLIVVIDICALIASRVVPGSFLSQIMIQIHIYLIICLLIMFGTRSFLKNRAVFFLSENSYAIFLIHLPMVRAVQFYCFEDTSRFSIFHTMTAWSVATAGCLFFILLGKRVFKKHSRFLIGA